VNGERADNVMRSLPPEKSKFTRARIDTKVDRAKFAPRWGEAGCCPTELSPYAGNEPRTAVRPYKAFLAFELARLRMDAHAKHAGASAAFVPHLLVVASRSALASAAVKPKRVAVSAARFSGRMRFSIDTWRKDT
jgi:hypothetical protein